MNHEQIIFDGKRNSELWTLCFIWRIAKRALGVLLFGIPTLLVFRNTILVLPITLIITGMIAWRVIHLLLLRRNQNYHITTRRIICQGGFLQRYKHELWMEDIRSISSTQSLLQSYWRAGDIVLSTASSRGTIILYDIDQVAIIHRQINEARSEKRHLSADSQA